MSKRRKICDGNINMLVNGVAAQSIRSYLNPEDGKQKIPPVHTLLYKKDQPFDGPFYIPQERIYSYAVGRDVVQLMTPLPEGELPQGDDVIGWLRLKGLLVDNRTSLPNRTPHVVGILIGIVYPDAPCRNHNVAAIKYHDTLFAFDSHGNTRNPVVTNVFNDVKDLYMCNKIEIYEGADVQGSLPVCSMFMTTFVSFVLELTMMTEVKRGRVMEGRKFEKWISDTYFHMSHPDMLKHIETKLGGRASASISSRTIHTGYTNSLPGEKRKRGNLTVRAPTPAR